VVHRGRGFARNGDSFVVCDSSTLFMKTPVFAGVSAALSAALFFVGRLIPAFQEFAGTAVWPAVAFGYAALSVLLFAWSARAMAGSPRAMVNALNGSTTVKMLVVLTAVTIYLLAGGEYRVQFALGLFAVFAAHSVLFVSTVLRTTGGEKSS